ncbi:MAG TPA: hypothetical protein VG371_03220 [Solirubrobacteraceae bacterium]|jgi:hypothetical protein|nr:hypothetical protein [Solirubrobacteraceae bacterium]
MGPRSGGVSAAEQPVVEAEHRHHGLVVVERGPEGGMVVEPEVAAQPEQGRHRSST